MPGRPSSAGWARAWSRTLLLSELRFYQTGGSFGFWRFLLARQYKTSLWPDLAGAFPHAPNRALSTVEEPVKRLHKFRNRIAHHEGIWHLRLEDRQADIQTVLGFIAPAAAAWVADASRLSDVIARRP